MKTNRNGSIHAPGLFLLPLFIMFFLASCSHKDSEPSDPQLEVTAHNISGSWELVEWNGMELAEGTYVYIDFTRRDRRFTMYQNQDSFLSRKIEGDYNIVYEDGIGSIIRGQYDFNGDWSHRYIITNLTANKMTWVALDDPGNVQVFQRCELPAGIGE